MGVEVPVLPGEQGVDEVLRHLVDRDRFPALLAEELGDLPVVDVEYFRGKGGLMLAELLFRGNIAGGCQGDAQRHSQEDGHRK